MDVPKAIGIDDGLFELLKSERMTGALGMEGIKVVKPTCPVYVELRKQSGHVLFGVRTIVAPAIFERFGVVLDDRHSAQDGVFPASSMARIARATADGNRFLSSKRLASSTKLVAFLTAAFIPSAICSGNSLPLYWSSDFLTIVCLLAD